MAQARVSQRGWQSVPHLDFKCRGSMYSPAIPQSSISADRLKENTSLQRLVVGNKNMSVEKKQF